MTEPVSTDALIRALQPILQRVRTDITAVKLSDGSRWTTDPLTPDRLRSHLAGGTPRGVCPIRAGESTTRLALLDLDSHRGESTWAEMAAAARDVSDLLGAMGLRCIPFRSSGGRGIHLFMLWAEPQDAYSVRQAICDALDLCGFKNGAKGVKHGQIEVFPKQDAVAIGENGSQFILPLTGRSEPLDPVFDYEPMGREFVLQIDWPLSDPVPLRERPVRVAASGDDVEDLGKVREALFAIRNDGQPGSPDYDEWFRIVCAVHEATGGSDDGLDLIQEWSAQNPIHDPKFADERVWRYVRRDRGVGITRATLYAKASDAGWGGSVGTADGFEEVTEIETEISIKKAQADRRHQLEVKHSAKIDWMRAVAEAVDEISLREDVCPRVRADMRLEPIDREMLAEAVKQKLAAFGGKVGIAACRKLVERQRPTTRETKTAEWTEGWVYVTDTDKFHRIDSEEFVTAQGFNAKFNRLLPPAPEGELPKSAHRVALDEIGIPTVTRGVYLPWAGTLFEMNGVSCVNLYRPSSTPEAAKEYTKAGRNAVALVRKHINLITGKRGDVERTLLSWMAYNVQNPGKKIRWSPLVKGIEGDGKTLIGRVLAAVMGEPNVKDISPKVLGTDFTGWAHGACVGVLEEIRLTGHNRYDIHNALKPYITNNSIAIHAKGQDEFTTVNTMNYVAFTNFADALPLDDNDRRFFVVFTPFSRPSDLRDAYGDVGEYFTALYDAIEQNRAELRKWFLEYQIDAGFNANGRAPSTSEKQEMVGMNVSESEDVIETVIEHGAIGVGKEIVALRYLRQAVRSVDPEAEVDGKYLTKILQKMGWSRHTKQVKWEGGSHRVWHRGVKGLDNAKIHELLNATKDFLDPSDPRNGF